ncbi:MAG: ATP-binding protein, partial [Anaerolineae bacterium]|nr:ATP-binding protein [Anaerolineae bacterium]
MQVNDSHNWLEANQRFLMASVGCVRGALEAYIAKSGNVFNKAKREKTEEHSPDALKINLQPPPALKTLCTAFCLSNFERDTLLLCAGMELDAKFPGLCATAQGDSTKAYPTFSLALAALPEPHWSALSPVAPLRHWRLIEIGTAHALTLSPIRIDERILNYLAGVQHLDGRLSEYLEPIKTGEELAHSHQKLADQISSTWANANGRSPLPIVHLTGNENAGKRGIAAAACNRFGLSLNAFSAQFMPSNHSEICALAQLLTREVFLSASALLLDCDLVDRTDSVRITAIHKLIESFQGVLIVASRDPWQHPTRTAITFEVRKPTSPEQTAIWQRKLGPAAPGMNGQIQTLVSQFSMNLQSISSVSAEVQTKFNPRISNPSEFGQLLWDACRVHSRPRLDDLAQFIEPVAAWDHLVLPEQEKQILKEIAIHLRQRIKVYENWGFANKGKRGLGISALFAGASGTGKTMAAEVLANEFKLDLYRIDLSSVVSKYIGETEKNLRRVFDAAEDSGTILLFDE